MPFGLFKKKAQEEHDRLDAVASSVDEATAGGADCELDIVAKGALELREVMETEIARGAKNKELMKRVEELSTKLLVNLERRVTSEVLQAPDGHDLVLRLIKIAKDLDAVRCTKASVAIQQKATKIQEALAEAHIKAIEHAMTQLSQPGSLVPASHKVLDNALAASKKAPDSAAVADRCLRNIVALANCLVTTLPTILRIDGPAPLAGKVLETAITASEEVSEKLDTVAEQLIVVVGARWDPPCTPAVKAAITGSMVSGFKARLDSVQAELVKGAANTEVAAQKMLECLPFLKSAWSSVSENADCHGRLIAVFQQVDTCILATFKGLSDAGNAAGVEAMMGFAQVYDENREGFDGAGLSDASLCGQMALGVSSNAGKHIDSLEKVFEKEGWFDASMQTLVMQLLTALVPLWSAALNADASMAGRLETAFTRLESRAEESMVSVVTDSLPERIGRLLTFAGKPKYDDVRAKFDHPAVVGEGLYSRLLPLAVTRSVAVAVEELTRTEGTSPQAILSSLAALADPRLQPGATAAFAEGGLAAALLDTEDRMKKAFEQALFAKPPETKKIQNLMQFAAKFDAARAGAGVSAAEATLGGQLQSMLERFRMGASFEAAEAQVAKGEDADLAVLKKALEAARAAAKAAGSGETIEAERIDALKGRLQPLLLGRLAAVPDGPEPFASRLAAVAIHPCQLAREADGLDASRGWEAPDNDDGSLGKAVAEGVLMCDAFAQIDAELAKEQGLNPQAILVSIQLLKEKWSLVQELPVFLNRLLGVFTRLGERMVDACLKAVAADEQKKVQALVAFARKYDEALDAADEEEDLSRTASLEHANDAKICEKLSAEVLSVAEAELGKEKGMNPVVVLRQMKTMGTLKEVSGCSDKSMARVKETQALIRERMVKSFEEVADAEGPGPEKKRQALRAFAAEFDAAFEAIGFVGASICDGMQDK